MPITTTTVALLVAVMAGAAIVLAAGAADAARAGRDAAIEKCVAYAQHYGSGTAAGTQRQALYKTCMTQEGYRP